MVSTLFLFVWICVLQVYSQSPGILSINIPTIEYTALYDLYSATGGTGWLWRNETFGQHWNFTSPENNPCVQHWQGLNCTLVPEMGTYLITQIHLNAYNLVGTLPPTIGNFAYLGALNLAENQIVGALPQQLQQLHYLEELDIFKNAFSGQIPSMLGSFPQLRFLAFGVNAFTGTIPAELGNLHNLEVLIMGNNILHGRIPPQLGNLQKLELLDMYHTGISGTIPASVGNMSAMRSFNLYNNSLEGPIPPSFGNMSLLQSITLGLNKLTGTLPSSLSALSNLLYIDFLGNQLTGTIPATWNSLNALHILYLNENQLEGSVDVLCELYSIAQVYFEQNLLSGAVPACLGSRAHLLEVYLNSNQLTGPLPDTLDQLHSLQYLELDDNFLTSTIPESFGRIPQLNKLFLSGNLLEGTLPSTISNLSSLALLQMQSNFLSGTISGVFNATTQPLLQGVLLTRNRFTGSIPLEPFLSRRFMQFSAVDNCLQGAVPEEICNCRSLRMLALDGIGTASTCRQPALPTISTSYLISHPLPGGIPACLFQLPNLTTLHLSGNGLTGSLPYELEIGDTLIDLALSHNLLTGRIPRAIQERTWYNLDLSYNRFNGELLSSFNTQTVTVEVNRTLLDRLHLHHAYTTDETGLSLSNNRLSGHIPATLQPVEDLDILNGNLFGCNWDQSDLPPHDSQRGGYQCGSNSFNTQYYAWLIITGLTLAVSVVVYRWRARLEVHSRWLKSMLAMLQAWYDAPNLPALEGSLKNFHYTNKIASVVNRVALLCTVLVTFIMTPLYVGLSHHYATVKFQYAWLVSAMFQSGVTPFAVLFVALILLLTAVIAMVKFHVNRYLQREALADEADSIRASDNRERLDSVFTVATPTQIYSAYATFFAASFVLVIGVNIAFVYIVLYADNSLLFFAQIFLSFFKGFWNSVGSVMVMRWAFNTLAGNTTGSDYHATLLFASLMNNIAIPCLVIATISPDCFYNLFVAPPSVKYTYVYLQCAIFVRDHCVVFDPRIAETSFVPPFTYSYECAAQYVMSYAPTFVYLAIEVAFLLPVMQALRSQRFLLARRGTRWHAFLAYTTPQVLQLVDEAAASETKRDKLYLCYDANLFLVQLLTYLCIMLTFGVVFPPLAAAMLVAIVSLTVVNRLIVGRYMLSAVEHNALHLVDNIEKDCRGVGVRQLRKLRTGAWMLVAFSCFFYALFLFDILGDDVGFHKAYWVLLLLPLMTAALFIGEEVRLRALARAVPSVSEQRAHGEDEEGSYEISLPRDIEMTKGPDARHLVGSSMNPSGQEDSNDVHNTLHL